jgi:hypothetical protein
MKKRYHIQSGEPRPAHGDEREWFVLDRSRVCSRDCEGCPGTVVFVGVTREDAREECAQLNNAEVTCQIQPPAASLALKESAS